MFSLNSSLCQYTFCADSCVGCLERTHRTAVCAILVDPQCVCCHVGLLKNLARNV